MFTFEEDANLVQDREDLLAILRMRFGSIPAGVTEAVYNLNKLDSLERLILVAANAPSLKIFLEELEEGNDSFRIMGERFNPIEKLADRGDFNSEKG